MNKKAVAGVVGFLSGVCAGTGLMLLHPKKDSPIGNLRIDESDPNEEPYMFLELNQGVGDIRKRKTVQLVVVDQNYVTAK